MDVSHILKSIGLHLGHYSQLYGHPGGRKLYLTLCKNFYWPTWVTDCYAAVKLCATLATNRVKLLDHKKPMKLFPSIAPPEYVNIEIFRGLMNAKRGKRYIRVEMDQFAKLARTVPFKKIIAGAFAEALTHRCVYYY